ncbi:hypothetical protein [Longimicrobium sp.]|uniref:hypothetical protein n=1 Tax=Longimicrobium sp. TaxID=2029185 RepID=UPI002E33F58E|nr:hypothetical protein [Longimicrobium sp.]HEX6038505.1 hypothetical protein [Longimicrobium sp.]
MSRRLRLAERLRLALPHAWSVLVGVGCIPAFGWYTLVRMDTDVGACRHAYARARTAADSAVVDNTLVGPRYSDATCRRLRAQGRLAEPAGFTKR